MKIVFLHMTMGITTRGSEVVIDSLATALSKKHEVMVIQSGKAEPKPYLVKRVYPQSEAPAVAPKNLLDKLLFRLHLDSESGAVTKFTSEAESVLTTFDPDIIVAVNGPLQVRLLQGQALNAKIVVFGHAGIGYHDRDNLRSKPDLFVALTPTARSWAKRVARSSTKIVYVPNPIRSVKPKTIKLNLPSPVVLTVSALSKYKNVGMVLQAIKNLPYSWLLIGDGEERGEIENGFSTLANDFRWLRDVDQTEIMNYYYSSDLFCFIPDPQEAFGMVYLEAMSAGLPIVASDDPVRRELIGEQGIYVDPNDKESVIKGIQYATTLGKLDYSKQLEKYSLKSVVDKIEKEFHDLIK
ncbi:glycosyltransferase family 4 protein [Candidatus Woesebacteria bacterium]|nr:glycosyltransferase family 4 protein [Candidatus Woesebacteria bacterium]